MLGMFYYACDEMATATAESPAETEPDVSSTAAAEEVDSPDAAPESLQEQPARDTAPQSVERLSNLDWHVMELRRQEAELRELIPDFDLQRELRRNPELLRLTAPGSPLTLAEALVNLNLPRLMALREQRLAREMREGLAKSIMSGCYRPPLMNGSAATEPAPMDREKLKERIRGGEKIRPG